MRHHESDLQAGRLAHHPHIPAAMHRIYERHTGHWLSDFPKSAAFILAGLIALLVFGLLRAVNVNIEEQSRWYLFR